MGDLFYKSLLSSRALLQTNGRTSVIRNPWLLLRKYVNHSHNDYFNLTCYIHTSSLPWITTPNAKKQQTSIQNPKIQMRKNRVWSETMTRITIPNFQIKYLNLQRRGPEPGRKAAIHSALSYLCHVPSKTCFPKSPNEIQLPTKR